MLGKDFVTQDMLWRDGDGGEVWKVMIHDMVALVAYYD